MRILRRIAIGLLVLLAMTLAGIQIYARVFRSRAEHLLADIKALRVEQTSSVDVLTLRTKYLRYVDDDGKCSAEHCRFSISLSEWESLLALEVNHPWARRPVYYSAYALRFFGLRITRLWVELKVEDRKLKSVRVEMSPLSYIERTPYAPEGFLSPLIVQARSVPRLTRWDDLPTLHQHPNFYVHQPSACTGCSGAIDVEFTAEASREEIETALGFDLSCITRFFDCRTPEEFLPRAGEIRQREMRVMSEYFWKDQRSPCDATTARILGRDSAFIGLVKIRSLKPEDYDGYMRVDYELVKTLKGTAPDLKDMSQFSEIFNEVEETSGGGTERSGIVGATRILFLGELFNALNVRSHCALITPTREHLDATIAGIAADHSSIVDQE